ncbi:hypothetical protein B7463_g4287, partial [Scytalidium lignicola]
MAPTDDKRSSITALPLTTTNLLGSAQTLTDPVSLIKELIDNAIDAKATFIHIHISSDTLSKIEVRDNGHGISLVDLNLLGRRGHTSKLRSFQELRCLGGTSLGFRGQALASAVELGQVTVTTRTDGEAAAMTVKLKPSGGIASKTHTSHPVGTTVSVSNFLSKLPVRKEHVLQVVSKTLSRTKSLVQSYVLARPQMKFSLNTINHRQGTWSFAPGSNNGTKEAILQVAGKAIASQCVERTLNFPIPSAARHLTSSGMEEDAHSIISISNVPESSTQKNEFSLQAFLPVKNADMPNVRAGQYISVDSRPMSCNKGVAKKIVILFKKYIRDTRAQNSSDKLNDPFLRLNIDCPPASYDPNVEPAKDDVLFEDEELVLNAAESLFRDVYGHYASTSQVPNQESIGTRVDAFEQLLTRRTLKPHTTENALYLPDKVSILESASCEAVTFSSSSNLVNNSSIREGEYLTNTLMKRGSAENDQGKWCLNMSKDYTEDANTDIRRPVNELSVPGDQICNLDPANPSSSMLCLNPWIIARMNRSVPENSNSKQTPSSKQTLSSKEGSPAVSMPISTMNRVPRHNFKSGTTRQSDAAMGNIESSLTKASPSSPPRVGSVEKAQDVQPSRASIEQFAVTDHKKEVSKRDALQTQTQSPNGPNSFVSARDIVDKGSLSPPCTQKRKFNSPITTLKKPLFIPIVRPFIGNAVHEKIQLGLPTSYRTSTIDDREDTLSRQKLNPDLDWAMDFEQRKEHATRHRRQQLRSARDKPETEPIDFPQTPTMKTIALPISPRTEKCMTFSNDDLATEKERLQTLMADRDPRSYWMRRRDLANDGLLNTRGAKPMQLHTLLLPLETTPKSKQIYNLYRRISISTSDIHHVMTILNTDDVYVRGQTYEVGLAFSGSDSKAVKARLQMLGDAWVDSKEGKRFKIDWMFEMMENSGVTRLA